MWLFSNFQRADESSYFHNFQISFNLFETNFRRRCNSTRQCHKTGRTCLCPGQTGQQSASSWTSRSRKLRGPTIYFLAQLFGRSTAFQYVRVLHNLDYSLFFFPSVNSFKLRNNVFCVGPVKFFACSDYACSASTKKNRDYANSFRHKINLDVI